MFLLLCTLIFSFGFTLGYGCTILTGGSPFPSAPVQGTTNQETSDESNDSDDGSENDDDEPIKRYFYVAGSYPGRGAIPPYIDSLSALGYQCTWDWTSAEAHSSNHEQMGFFAAKDIEGVMNADVLIAIIDNKDYAYRGTFTEIGCALGLGIPVVVFCPHPHDEVYARSNCFFCHPAIRHVSTWDEAIQAVEEILG